MTSDRLVYEGAVILCCQEGGFAHPAIRCLDGGAGEVVDLRDKLRALFDGAPSTTLDQLLVEIFGEGTDLGMGDRGLGRLRITVERMPEHDEPPMHHPV